MFELLSDLRCDRCSKDRKGCSKEINGCTRCRKGGFECTYFRRRKKDKNYKFKEEVGSIQIFKMDSNKALYKNNFENLISLDQGKLKTPNSAIKILVKNFKLRSTYSSMATLLGGNIFSKPPDLVVCYKTYSQFLNILHQESEVKKVSPNIEEYEMNWIDDYNDAKEEALQFYFKYTNLLDPLFLHSTFDSNKRSSTLMAAIYAAGLTYMPNTPRNSVLKKYCHALLLKKLKKIECNPNLETLQITVITFQALKSIPSFYELIEVRFETLCHIAYQLGLHLNLSNTKNRQGILERKLCFCALVHITIVRLVAFDCPSPFPSYIHNEKLDLLPEASKLTNNFSDLCSIIMGEYNYHQTFLYISFNENRSRYEDTYESSENFAYLYIKKLKAQIINSYKKFNNLHKGKNIKYEHELLVMYNSRAAYHSHCLLISRYLLLRAQSLPSEPPNGKRIEKCQKLIELMACNILEHIYGVPFKDRMYIHYGMLCFALSLLFLHITDPSPSTKDKIQRSLLLMEDSDKVPLLSSSTPLKMMILKVMALKNITK